MRQTEETPARLARVEESQTACIKQQDERYKEIMSRVRRIEDRSILMLGGVILTLLGIIANIAIAVLKK